MAIEINNLPQEIIIEILSRLPVKTLILLRSVSKSYHSSIITLINDPNFIKKHLSQSINKRVLLFPSSSSTLLSYNISSLLSDNNFSITQKSEKLYPLDKKTGRVLILGSCNGLFFIWINAKTYLWNPSTRKTKKLPSPPFKISIHIHNGFFPGFNVSGLGYDSYNDDFKVISLVKFSLGKCETMLYSLKDNSWRIIQDYSPYTLCIKTSGNFLNGSLHWLIQDSSYYGIVTFDLFKEKYEKTKLLPNDLVMPKSSDQRFGLTILRGMLCLYCNSFKHHFVLWTMKEYGVEKSWTQVLKFEYSKDHISLSPSNYYSVYVVPKFMFENGELLLEARNVADGVTVMKYREEKLQVVVKGGLTELGQVHVYPESLFSFPLVHI